MGNLALVAALRAGHAELMSFHDRVDAGRQLGERLRTLDLADPVLVGLPRGGVVVAAEAARVLDAPLDVVVVRKLGAPGRPELGIGAIGEEGIRALNQELIELLGVTEAEVAAVEARESEELARRVIAYRGERTPPAVQGRTVVVVDDGLATGFTARAALRVLRKRGAARLILAVPVSARDTARALQEEADQVVVLETPFGFGAVGQWYADFRQTMDEEVIRLLQNAAGSQLEDVVISIGRARLPGLLATPSPSHATVVFAHGSGSSRLSPRNRRVAEELNEHGYATLLFDLLTEEEAHDRTNVFDIDLLATRLTAAVDWLRESGAASIGLFGASTGAAAALIASIDRPIGAVVSRGGRPDLAGDRLTEVTAPVLLIVGSRDSGVLDLNRAAADALSGPSEVSVVPGAGHLFEEPGALADVSARAAGWFRRWLGRQDRQGAPTRKHPD